MISLSAYVATYWLSLPLLQALFSQLRMSLARRTTTKLNRERPRKCSSSWLLFNMNTYGMCIILPIPPLANRLCPINYVRHIDAILLPGMRCSGLCAYVRVRVRVCVHSCFSCAVLWIFVSFWSHFLSPHEVACRAESAANLLVLIFLKMSLLSHLLFPVYSDVLTHDACSAFCRS